MSYTQDNNFFSYTTLNDEASTLNTFPNQITWTKTKVVGEDIDTWTNITLASIADADGNKGEITKIVNYNDKLILFQDNGISQIGYNEKTAISTENGVPLEIANSGKYTGLYYISDKIGCQNKWSICNANIGIIFIDDDRREINLLNNEGISSLSTINGFRTFLNNELQLSNKEWDVASFGNFKTFYDSTTKDIYFINSNKCLAFNELSNSFTSFYNYQSVPLITNVNNKSVTFNKTHLHYLREGNPRDFFGKLCSYSFTLCCDGIIEKENNSLLDKIFNTIEYRGDTYLTASVKQSSKTSNYNAHIFNKIAAENEYQVYKEFDITDKTLDSQYPWEATRLFNIWRTPIPRASYFVKEDKSIKTTRDRIRNPYCYITLLDNTESNHTERAVIHDFVVYYTAQ
jgi:hypothetical protein